jgi:hypothetical protein
MIGERVEAARRERRVLTRVSRAGRRLEQAEREPGVGAGLGAGRGVSIRKLAALTRCRQADRNRVSRVTDSRIAVRHANGSWSFPADHARNGT